MCNILYADSFQNYINTLSQNLFSNADVSLFSNSPVKINNFVSSDNKIYPLDDYLKNLFQTQLLSQKIPVSAEFNRYTLDGEYIISKNKIHISTKILDWQENQKIISSADISIPIVFIDKKIITRNINTIAGELAEKLWKSSIINQHYFNIKPITLKDKGIISEFSQLLRQTLVYELIKNPQWHYIESDSHADIITGNYFITDDNIYITLSLLDNKSKKINVFNTDIKKQDIPNVSLYPENIDNAYNNLKHLESDKDNWDKTINIKLWTNRKDNIFRPGEKLQIHLKSNRDCFINLYYLQADNTIIQIYPNKFSEKNQMIYANIEYRFPDSNDPYEFEITPEPLGQEMIIAYASDYQINDNAFIRKKMIADLGLNIINNTFSELVRGLAKARGLNINPKSVRYNYEVLQTIIKE